MDLSFSKSAYLANSKAISFELFAHYPHLLFLLSSFLSIDKFFGTLRWEEKENLTQKDDCSKREGEGI